MKKILADYEIQKRKEGRKKAEDCRKSEQLEKLNPARRLRDSLPPPPTAFHESPWVKQALGGADLPGDPAKEGCWGLVLSIILVV